MFTNLWPQDTGSIRIEDFLHGLKYIESPQNVLTTAGPYNGNHTQQHARSPHIQVRHVIGCHTNCRLANNWISRWTVCWWQPLLLSWKWSQFDLLVSKFWRKHTTWQSWEWELLILIPSSKLISLASSPLNCDQVSPKSLTNVMSSSLSTLMVIAHMLQFHFHFPQWRQVTPSRESVFFGFSSGRF